MKTLLSIMFVGVLSLVVIFACLRSCAPVVPVQQSYAPGYGAPAYNQPVAVHDNSGGIVSHGLAAGAGYMLGKHAAKSAQAPAASVAAPTPAPVAAAPAASASKWKRAPKQVTVAPSKPASINLNKTSSAPTRSSGGSKWGGKRR